MTRTRLSIEQTRRAYAEELRAVAPIRHNEAVVKAFATVPRERFLEPGPWHVLSPWTMHWSRTPDANPCRLYHDVLVAIDRKRGLNNGQPGFWARLLDQLDIKRGERVLQVGTGTGYYTAILAELVGRRGRVVAVEYDRGLARRASANLKPWPQVTVVHGDGTAHDPGEVDVVVAFAGSTHPAPLWLDRLAEGGRLLVPLTGKSWFGFMMLARRRRAKFDARSLGGVGIFHCAGGRNDAAAERLWRALRRLRGAPVPVKALHRGKPPASAKRRVWYAGPGFWLEGAQKRNPRLKGARKAKGR
jgi:protein-L-isoaspartate(D-aspartate) O-methyltransferase